MSFSLEATDVTHATLSQDLTGWQESASARQSGRLDDLSPKGTQRTKEARSHVGYQLSPVDGGFSERVFDARVVLKRAVSTYAMYLSDEERQRLFNRLDVLLSEASWYEDDPFPTELSFRAFLKWMVHSPSRGWSSIGSDAVGNILVAWVSGQNIMTAQFAHKVRWTTSVHADGGAQTSAGTWDLEYFAHNAAILHAQIEWH